MEHLGTKAETLALMYGKLNTAKVLPQLTFTVADWERRRAEIVCSFSGLDWNADVIVRSSCHGEDTQDASMAGKYESIADVRGVEAFQDAVDRVVRSYGEGDGSDQILVQPMLQNAAFSGVAFTLDPGTCGNYYVVNYDETGQTSAVTGKTQTAAGVAAGTGDILWTG